MKQFIAAIDKESLLFSFTCKGFFLKPSEVKIKTGFRRIKYEKDQRVMGILQISSLGQKKSGIALLQRLVSSL